MTPTTPRVLRWLLRAFPPEFRQAYADDMAATFASRRAAARRQSLGAVGALWIRTTISLLIQGLAERRRSSFRRVGGSSAPLARPIQWAARRLRRSPAFSVATFVTLAVGFAGAIAVFSIVDSVLIRPLPYPDANRLVTVSHTLEVHGGLRVDQSDASLLFFRRHHPPFAAFGGYQTAAVALGPGGGADAERVVAGRVTAGVFETLGLSPLRGRLFTRSDDEPDAPAVAILSERLWHRRFGGDASLLSRPIVVNDEPREVIGIVSDDVRFPSADTELWTPLQLNPAQTDSASFDYQAVARLRDGLSIGEAESELQPLLLRLPDEFPGRLTRKAIDLTHMRMSVRPLASVMVEGVATPLWIVLAAAGVVLFAACANAACLFLVRAESHRNTFAIQRALGAAPRTVLWEFLSEVLILVSLAGICGLAVAAVSVRALRTASVGVDIPRFTEVTVGPAIVAMAALASACVALMIGGVAAWRSRLLDTTGLAPWHPGPTAGRVQHRTRYALVAVQMALAMLLVAGSGLMARSLWHLQRVPPGFDAARALTFRLALPASVYPSAQDGVRFFARALEAVSNVPGVQAAGATSKLPLEDRPQDLTGVFFESQPMAPGDLPHLFPVDYVAPEYFRAMGIPVVEGTLFKPSDPAQPRLEVVVSRTFAARSWPGRPAIGQRVQILVNGPSYTVVGVVGDVRDSALDRPDDAMIYCPLLPPNADRRWTPRDLAIVVRATGDPAALTGAIRAAIRRLDSSLPVYHIQTLDDLLGRASARRALVLDLLALTSAIAIVLSVVGLYGAMAYVVSLRTREIGIRMALGESSAAVGWLLVRQGVIVATIGVGIGLATAIGLAKALSAWLYDVAPSDPPVMALSVLLLLALAVVASWIPSRRAAAVNPALALRGE